MTADFPLFMNGQVTPLLERSPKHIKIQLLSVDNRVVSLSTNIVSLTTDFSFVDNETFSVVNESFGFPLIL